MTDKTSNHIPTLDGLRAISIMLVYVSHLFVASKLMVTSPIPGGLGVTIFFFISGYLITNLLFVEFKKNNAIDLKSFYIRRILRLYPPMLMMMVCIVVLLIFIHAIIPFNEITAALLYYENYFIVFNKSLVFKYSILWSLAVEEHFYLIYPIILIRFIKKPMLLFGIVAILTVVPLLFRCIITYHYNVDDTSFLYTYQTTHCRYDSILYGCLTSIIISGKYAERFFKSISSKPIYLTFLALFLFTLMYRNEFFRQTFRFSIQGICLMVLVPPIIYTKSFHFVNKILSIKGFVFVGKLSYSIYLFHHVVLELQKSIIFKNSIVFVIVNVLLTAILSLGSYYYIELPMMKLRRRFGAKVKCKVLSSLI